MPNRSVGSLGLPARATEFSGKVEVDVMTLSDLHVTDKRVLHEAMLVLARYKRSSAADGTSVVK